MNGGGRRAEYPLESVVFGETLSEDGFLRRRVIIAIPRVLIAQDERNEVH